MSVDPPTHQPLGGLLLLAGLELLESTFKRTVVLITRHEKDEGAVGYILNRPLDKRVGDLLPAAEFSGLGDVPAFFGGPVSNDHLTFAAIFWDAAAGAMVGRTNLSAAEAHAMHLEGYEVRGFVGYSGWSPGQLEGELAAGAWEVQRPASDDLLRLPPGQLWPHLIRGLSPIHRIAADMPDDLSLN
jgi:putative transcriptional regulator